MITFAAWEGIEAKQRGIELRTFEFGDYGFPDFYQVVLACDSRWLAAEPDLARAFVAATVRGFEFAADDPDSAAALLVAQNPGVFDGNPELPLASQQFLADGRLPSRRERGGRPPDAGQVAGLLGLPLRAGPAGRPGRQAARDRARLPGAVHQRLPAVRPTRLGRWGPPLALARDRRPGLGGIRPPGRHRPDHAAGAVAGGRARCGTSARRRSAT